MIGRSQAFLKAVHRIPTIARAEGAVLILGETGTGKELVARAIHAQSHRAGAPFVAVNCGSLIDTLFEAEVFGHERGAFTDAHHRKTGLIVEADGGTLFLDEVDSLAPRAQVSLLRLLQDHTYRVLGSTREQMADVRFVAASNVSRDRLASGELLRVDLYYRLSVFLIALPSLRERVEDISLLASHFVRKYFSKKGAAPRLSDAAIRALASYRWPGNIRELENVIQRSVCLAQDGTIDSDTLELPAGPSEVAAAGDDFDYKAQKRKVIESFEREFLTRLMTKHRGNVTWAARVAGKDRRDLGKLLKRHSLDPKGFAKSP